MSAFFTVVPTGSLGDPLELAKIDGKEHPLAVQAHEVHDVWLRDSA